MLMRATLRPPRCNLLASSLTLSCHGKIMTLSVFIYYLIHVGPVGLVNQAAATTGLQVQVTPFSIYCHFFSPLHFLLADFLLLLRYSLLMSSFYFVQLLLLVSFLKVEKLGAWICYFWFKTKWKNEKICNCKLKTSWWRLGLLIFVPFSFLFLFKKKKDISKVNFKTLFDRNMATDPWVDYKENLMLSRVITGTTCCFPGVSCVQRLL